MDAEQAARIAFNIKYEKLIESIFKSIKSAAENGKFEIDTYMIDYNLSNYFRSLGYRVNTDLSSRTIISWDCDYE